MDIFDAVIGKKKVKRVFQPLGIVKKKRDIALEEKG